MGVLSNPYEEYNFCLDGKKLRYGKGLEQGVFRRFTLRGEIRVEGNEARSISVSYDIPYFRDVVELDIGEKVHQYFMKYSENILDKLGLDHFVLEPCLLSVESEELGKNYSVLSTERVGEYYFYPGKRPKGYPLFTNHLQRRRVGGEKFLFSSVGLVDNSWGVLGRLPSRAKNLGVYCLKLGDSDLHFGRRKLLGGLEVVTFPKARRVIGVQWLNGNLVPEWASFTGEYKVVRSFSHSISKGVYHRSMQKKYDTEEEKVLKVNTGFILKSEIGMLEELMVSPFCFVELEDRYLKCIPSGEKLGEEDSAGQLIQFELEFIIIEERWK